MPSTARPRRGYKRSRPSHNVECLPEKTLKLRSKQDQRLCRKFKKRHRKDLTSEEVAKLVEATKEPYRTHKDVAKEFQVPVPLVHTLAKEAVKKPEKLAALRRREEDMEWKKLAVEEAATKMLAANVPIVRAQQVQEAVQHQANVEVSSLLV